MVLARQAPFGHLPHHLPDDAAKRVLDEDVVTDEIVSHHRSP
jgi:hypothetical protein